MLSDLEQKSVDILFSLCEYKRDKLAAALSDDAVLIDLLGGYDVRGKDEILSLPVLSDDPLLQIGNLSVKKYSLHPSVFSVEMCFPLEVVHPNAAVRRCTLKITFDWAKQRQDGENVWKLVRSCVFRNDMKPKDVQIYAETAARQHRAIQYLREACYQRRIMLWGDDKIYHFIRTYDIRYVEADNALRSVVHSDNGDYSVRHLLGNIEKQLPDYFYRCHASYVVNLYRVVSLSNYRLMLDDGTVLPVPEKRYSKIKADIQAWMAQAEDRQF